MRFTLRWAYEPLDLDSFVYASLDGKEVSVYYNYKFHFYGGTMTNTKPTQLTLMIESATARRQCWLPTFDRDNKGNRLTYYVHDHGDENNIANSCVVHLPTAIKITTYTLMMLR